MFLKKTQKQVNLKRKQRNLLRRRDQTKNSKKTLRLKFKPSKPKPIKQTEKRRRRMLQLVKAASQ